MAVMAESGSH